MTQVCEKCQAALQMKKMGITVIETSGNPPTAIRLWKADLLACPICGAGVIAHFSHEPMMERHEAGFGQALKGIPKEARFILYNPEYLATQIRYETKIVRRHAHA